MDTKKKHDEVEDREREFHDDWASAINPGEVQVDQTFEASTSPEPRWLYEQMGDVRGKKILDLGAGAGEASVFLAKNGADVTATDLSPKMLDVINMVAEKHNVNLTTAVSSAENLSQFDDNTFDVVYAANLLHHVDIQKCLDEVKRVLVPGGIGAFWDPVAHNPVINVYREMASEVRTDDEHPIKRKQMSWFKNRFFSVKARFFWLTSLVVFLKFYLIDRIHPSADRYWKRILTHESSIKWLYVPLAKLDRLILAVLPILGWWCWNVAIIVRKEKK